MRLKYNKNKIIQFSQYNTINQDHRVEPMHSTERLSGSQSNTTDSLAGVEQTNTIDTMSANTINTRLKEESR